MRNYRFLSGVLGVLFIFMVSSLAYADSEAIGNRQKLMKSNSKASKALKKAVSGKDYAAIETNAKEIAGNLGKVTDLFPKGSTSEKSRALPAIWEKWDDFVKKAGTGKKAASDLADAAKAKDQGKVEAAYKALGSACGSCHKPFRAEKKK